MMNIRTAGPRRPSVFARSCFGAAAGSGCCPCHAHSRPEPRSWLFLITRGPTSSSQTPKKGLCLPKAPVPLPSVSACARRRRTDWAEGSLRVSVSSVVVVLSSSVFSSSVLYLDLLSCMSSRV
ncbi:unnamed protein product [Bursaphelenchus xylophilus]|uniref:(pine wood nematode) hypothetical protein n=1 Tax=Bursaphelenchus xylophilus TaxID=6326 RepID=A0A1I7SAF3_BURXY|nr:unnamed protein product [Bursaphelenchus xylophilus]CAG9083963.1 unnamed protein product [Bursaphelenchus xylophilus]